MKAVMKYILVPHMIGKDNQKKSLTTLFVFFVIALFSAFPTVHTTQHRCHIEIHRGAIGVGVASGLAVGLLAGIITSAIVTIPGPKLNNTTPMIEVC